MKVIVTIELDVPDNELTTRVEYVVNDVIDCNTDYVIESIIAYERMWRRDT